MKLEIVADVVWAKIQSLSPTENLHLRSRQLNGISAIVSIPSSVRSFPRKRKNVEAFLQRYEIETSLVTNSDDLFW